MKETDKEKGHSENKIKTMEARMGREEWKGRKNKRTIVDAYFEVKKLRKVQSNPTISNSGK